jgi:hypothetical protein
MERYREVIVRFFFIGKQKVLLFPIFKENGWECVVNALRALLLCLDNKLALEFAINAPNF